MSKFVFTSEQLVRISKDFPGPCGEEALNQFRSDFGEFAPEESGFVTRHGMLVEKWERFCERKDQKSLEKFWECQEALSNFHRSCWGEEASYYWEPLTSSVTGVQRLEAQHHFLSSKAKEGLRELKAQAQDLVVQFKMR